MPVFEYHCPRCGAHRDVYVVAHADAVDRVEVCHACGDTMRRSFPLVGGFDLRGAGFHAVDYPSGGGSTPDRK